MNLLAKCQKVYEDLRNEAQLVKTKECTVHRHRDEGNEIAVVSGPYKIKGQFDRLNL